MSRYPLIQRSLNPGTLVTTIRLFLSFQESGTHTYYNRALQYLRPFNYVLDEPLLGVLGEGDNCGDCGALEVGLATGDLGCCCCSDAVRLLPILAAAAADVCVGNICSVIIKIHKL